MKVTTYEGLVENGRIRLPADARLPDKARVYVIVPDVETPPIAYVGSPRFAHPEQTEHFRKEVLEENNDARV
ncbi:MAG: hypothetical protein AABO57_03200 [Acidobacteriota bacterium]